MINCWIGRRQRKSAKKRKYRHGSTWSGIGRFAGGWIGLRVRGFAHTHAKEDSRAMVSRPKPRRMHSVSAISSGSVAMNSAPARLEQGRLLGRPPAFANDQALRTPGGWSAVELEEPECPRGVCRSVFVRVSLSLDQPGYSTSTNGYLGHGRKYSMPTGPSCLPSLARTNGTGSATISDQVTVRSYTIRSPWSRS